MSNPAPTLSVIMTVYNGEAFLQETLDAVWAQTFTDFELVVVNNGCTDGTQDILDAVTDGRLRVLHAPSHGTFGDGIRMAYRNARGRYIAVQDADDVSLPERFAKQVAALDDDASLGIVFGAFQDMNETGVLGEVHHPPATRQGLINAFQTHNPLAHSTYMYRRVATDLVQGYPPQYAYGPDFGLVMRLMQKGWGVKVLDDIVLKLRLHPGQTSIAPKLTATRSHDALYLFKEAAQLPGVSTSARHAGRLHLAKCRILYGLALVSEARISSGLGHLGLALASHPLYGFAYLGYSFARRAGFVRSTEE